MGFIRTERREPLSAAYKHYALLIATAVYMLNLVDRGLMILLLQPIKDNLRLTDTQLGALTGIAFALFYVTAGVPIARYADRGNRSTIAASAIGAWGLTLMLTPLVTNYLQLLLARACAAIGEAGCKPATYSLVGDYFPAPAERTRALAIYMGGGLLANLVSFMGGSWLYGLYGWRMAFLLMGIPGVVLAIVVKFTLVDPRCTSLRGTPVADRPSIWEVIRTLWRRRALRHLTLALILLYTMSFGLSPWYAAFLMRSHGMSTHEIGISLGLIFGFGGLGGALIGGYVSGRWFPGRESRQMRFAAITVGCLVPCFALFLLVPSDVYALSALIPLILTFNFFLGPTYALLQRLVKAETRATTLAIVMLLVNLIGMGVGPEVVGILSDGLASIAGGNALRYAMLSMSLVALAAAWEFWRVGRHVMQDLAFTERSNAPRAV